MTKLELVTEAIYDALANHHRINWSQADAAARAALASIEAPADVSVHAQLVEALQAMVALDECEAHFEEAYERILPQARAALSKATHP